MITQEIYIDRVGWRVTIFHAVTSLHADEILDRLIGIGCRGEELREAKEMLWSGMPNCGMTYSNLDRRRTVMVIGVTSSGSEYWNTLDHEKGHLLQHIADACGVDPFGEEIAYISGEVLREVHEGEAKALLCDCCRKKMGQAG